MWPPPAPSFVNCSVKFTGGLTWGQVWMTGTRLLPEGPHSLLLDFIVSVAVTGSPLLWFVIAVLYETVRPLVDFLSGCGLFVTSQPWSKFFCQHGWSSWCLVDYPCLPTCENCEIFRKTASLVLPIFLLGLVIRPLTLAHELSYKASERPTLAPLQLVLVRLCYFEDSSLFVWIPWLATWSTSEWNRGLFLTLLPTTLAPNVFGENTSEQVQFWTVPEEMGHKLCGQEGGMRATTGLRMKFFPF